MPKGTFRAPAFVETLTTLTDEVGDGLYCARMGINAGQCRSAWLGLCDFIFNVLKKNKASPALQHTHTHKHSTARHSATHHALHEGVTRLKRQTPSIHGGSSFVCGRNHPSVIK